MKIADVRFAYPNIEYTVDVSHFTARKSTAIEWLILEAIKRCGELPDYSEWSARDVFETIFMISDPNLLVLPCMISLLELGAIEADALSDDSELSEIPMKSLRLTEIGAEMQQRGLLPGVMDNNDITVSYDPLTGKLASSADTRYEEPDGVLLMDTEKLDNIGFPQTAVMDMLTAELRSEKKSGKRFPWLMPNTRIEQLNVVSKVVLWRSVTKQLCVGQGLFCSVEGIDDPDTIARALRSLANDNKDGTELFPYIDISDPDKDVKEIINFDDISRRLDSLARSGNIVIINDKYYIPDISQKKNGKNALVRILIVEGCSEFSISIKDKLFTVFYDGKLLPSNEVFQSEESAVCIGRFKLKAFGVEQDLTLGYVPLSCSVDSKELAKQAISERLEMDHRMPFVLYALGMKNECLEILKESIKHAETISEKAKLIEKLNTVSKDLFRMTCISSELAEMLLVDADSITKRCVSIDAALDVLDEYSSMRQQEELYKKVLKTVLENMPAADSREKLFKLWRYIKTAKRAYITYVVRNDLYQRFYNNTVVEELLGKFNDEDFLSLMVEEYTPVESALYNMRQAFNDVLDILSDIETDSDEGKIKAAVLSRRSNKEEIERLQKAVREWRDSCDKLEETLTSITELSGLDRGFDDTAKMMNSVFEAVSLFCNTSSIKYSNVVIADTCALMHEPDLISWCDDGRTLLIIPQTVLAELDKLKDDEDEDKAYQARMAVRSIANHNAFEWLNTKELSDVSLLNSDLDAESGDSKILSVAIRYIVKDPIIITDDINFRNIAEAQGITSISTESYYKKKQLEAKEAAASIGNKKVKNKSKKKKR